MEDDSGNDGQRKMRTLLAYLIAPMVAAIVATLWFGPSWDLLLVSCMMSYPISWVIGTCAVVILKKKERRKEMLHDCWSCLWSTYTICFFDRTLARN